MNVTKLCLNGDVRVNLNYPDCGGTEARAIDKNKNFVWFLLEIIAFVSVITSIIGRCIYVGKEIFRTLEINSQLGFLNFLRGSFPLTIFGLIKDTWLVPIGLFFF